MIHGTFDTQGLCIIKLLLILPEADSVLADDRQHFVYHDVIVNCYKNSMNVITTLYPGLIQCEWSLSNACSLSGRPKMAIPARTDVHH